MRMRQIVGMFVVVVVAATALADTSHSGARAASPAWNVSGAWKAFAGDLALQQTASGSLSGTFRMRGGCTATYRVTGKIDGGRLSLSLVRAGSAGVQGQCAGTQTLKGLVADGGRSLKLVLANFAHVAPPAVFTGHASRNASGLR